MENKEEKCVMGRKFICADDNLKIELVLHSTNGIVTSAEYLVLDNNVVTKKENLTTYNNETLDYCKQFLIEKCGCKELKLEEK